MTPWPPPLEADRARRHGRAPGGGATRNQGWVARLAVLGAVAGALLLAGVEAAAAQGQAGAEGTLRPFWHVFAAYALAWLILFGWLVSIGRRLRRVEERTEGEAASSAEDVVGS